MPALHSFYRSLNEGAIDALPLAAIKTPAGFALVLDDGTYADEGNAPGCIKINTTTGVAYINEGSATTASWKRIEAGDTNLADGEFVKFGTGNDVTFNFDGTSMEIESAAAATPLLIGADSKVLNTTLKGTFTVGKDATGHDVKFFGDTTGKYFLWDESADKVIIAGAFDITGASQFTGTVTIGVNDTGHDFKAFGATAGKYLEWDESEDTLNVVGNASVSGALTLTGGAATAAVVARFGDTATEGLEVKVIDEIVSLTNAAATDLTQDVPAGAVILSVQANLNTAITGDASGDDGLTKVGIGIAADPDKYGKTSALTKNAKVDTLPDWAVLSGAEDIKVYAVDNAGDAVTEKFVAAGLVRVRIVYLAANSLDDAA